MKLIKLSVISAAVLGTTAAMAAQPATNTVVATPAPQYQYNPNAGVIRNTTGAVVDTTRTIFDTAIHPAAISAEAGTLGYGANIAWGLNESTELQAGWAGGDAASLIGGDFDAKNVNYDLETDFSNPYLGVNLRPAGNWFTVSTGIIVPDNQFTAKANAKDAGDNAYYPVDGKHYYVGAPTKTLEAGDLTNVGSVTVDLEHRNKLAPYATIGFRPNINSNWGVFGEVGGAYLGKVDAKVKASGANGALAQQKIEEEIESENLMRWLPIAKVGVTYRF